MTFMVVLVGYLVHFATIRHVHQSPHGDGFFTWMYARSLAFDHDVHLANDYLVCNRKELLEDVTATGRPANYFYVGPAVILAPLLQLARWLVRLPPGSTLAVESGCVGAYVGFVGRASALFATFTLFFAYRIGRRFAPRWACLVATLAIGFGSTLLYYGTALWFYSHLWSALGVALLVLAALRAYEGKTSPVKAWLAVGLAAGFAALMRTPEALWLVVPGALFVLREIETEPRTGRLRRAAIASACTAVGFAALFWIQLVVYKKTFGVYFAVPQGKLYLQWLRPHPFLLLFSQFSGFFTWTPLVYLGVTGLGMLLFREQRRIAAVLLAAAVLEVYVASCPLAWTGSGTYGARLLTPLVSILVAGTAVAIERAVRFALANKARTRVVLAMSWLMPFLFIAWGLDQAVEKPPFAYGEGARHTFEDIYRVAGNPFAWPATVPFRLRYGVGSVAFDRLASSGMFVHDFRTAKLVSEDLFHFGPKEPYVYVATGTTLPDGSLLVTPTTSRVLVSLYWPWVTHLSVSTDHCDEVSPSPATVDVTVKGAVTTLSRFSIEVDDKPRWGPPKERTIAVPERAFDTGILELELRATQCVRLVSVRWVDRTDYRPLLQKP